MGRTRSRDFFLGVIATCLLLITVRMYDTSFTKQAHADDPTKPIQVEIIGQSKPLELSDQRKPLRVEMVRPSGSGGNYVPVFDQQRNDQAEVAIPVQIMALEVSGGKLTPVRLEGGKLLTNAR